MSNKVQQIRTPSGRLVQGSLYRGNSTDRDGNPLVYKSGAKAGQPRLQYYFAVAIPKGTESHWSQTSWGAIVHNVGVTAFPQVHASRNFAWKITDGDSVEPNMEGIRPCDCQGFAGCWVLRFSSSLAPKICTAKGEEYIAQQDFVNLGDWVQVAATVDGNDSTQQPGIYLNGVVVAFQGYGERILVGIDPKSVGFGQDPLPAGCSPTPIGQLLTGAPEHGNVSPVYPAPSGIYNPPPAQPLNTPAAYAPAAVTPPPYPEVLMPPVPAPAAPPPAPAPAAPMRLMTAAAQGFSYESYIAQGWKDDDLIKMGLMVI